MKWKVTVTADLVLEVHTSGDEGEDIAVGRALDKLYEASRREGFRVNQIGLEIEKAGGEA